MSVEFNPHLPDIRRLLKAVPKSQRRRQIAELSSRTMQGLWEDYIAYGVDSVIKDDLMQAFREWGFTRD